MDCIYEAKDEDGLEIKWFFDDKPIYQWIPYRTDPRSIGNLSKRIDLKYKVTDNEIDKYRALRIMNLTLDLSGTYTCKVSSYYSEKTETKKIVIYGKYNAMPFFIIKTLDIHLCFVRKVRKIMR